MEAKIYFALIPYLIYPSVALAKEDDKGISQRRNKLFKLLPAARKVVTKLVTKIVPVHPTGVLCTFFTKCR